MFALILEKILFPSMTSSSASYLLISMLISLATINSSKKGVIEQHPLKEASFSSSKEYKRIKKMLTHNSNYKFHLFRNYV